MNSVAHTPFSGSQKVTPLSVKAGVIAVVISAHLAILHLWAKPSVENAYAVSELSVSFAQATPSRPQQRRLAKATVPDKLAQVQPAPVAEQATAAAAPEVATPASVPVVSEPDYKAAYLNNTPPAYPLAARRMGLQGRVVLHVEVLAGGGCGQINIHQSSGYAMLDNAALETVKTWRFVPARQGGSSVDKWFMIPVQFSLKDNA
jgi:protein TonB